MTDPTQHTGPMDVSIVIVSFNTRSLTRQCLQSIQEHAAGIRYEVIVVDNASSDGSADMVAATFPWVSLIRLDQNRGFAGGNIPGMQQASGRTVLLLNSDAFLAPGVLQQTLAYMDSHPHIGVLGCRLTNPDGSLQPSARGLPGPLNKLLHITGLAARFPRSRFFGRVDFTWWDHSTPRSVGWVVGAFFLIRADTMADIGYLDDRYFLYFEEIDYCLSAKRAGWDVVFYPHASVVHLGGQSSVKTGQRVSSKGRQMISIRITSEFRYYRKMYGFFHVLASAAIEFGWNQVVIFKNRFLKAADSAHRIEEARTVNRLIAQTLRNDRWGKGPHRVEPDSGGDRFMFDNIRQDLKTYKGNWGAQGFWAMIVYRFGRWRYTIRNPFLRKPCSLIYKFCYKCIQIITGIELPCEVTVGKNFRIDHFGGIVISGFASFGDNCILRNGVTVGLRRVENPVAPKIGNHVNIGAGAVILGDITVGDHVVIGANAVVLNDVPSNSIAVGVPARIIGKKDHE